MTMRPPCPAPAGGPRPAGRRRAAVPAGLLAALALTACTARTDAALSPPAAVTHRSPAAGTTAPAPRHPADDGAVSAPRRPADDVAESALHRLVTDGAPGAASLATRGGGSFAARFATTGVADLHSGRRIGPQDHFRAGSITKTLVATVILQLVAEGRLTLHDSAAAHLPPGVPTRAKGDGSDLRRVTIRQLLDHTSGLFNYTADPRLSRQLGGAGFGAHRYDSHTPGELLRIALNHPPVAPPGTRYAYSNTNYLVLGLVIEAVTGHPYAAEIRRRILVPAGLGHTSFPGTDPVLPEPHGRGYARIGHRRVDATSLDPSRAGAAGEMITTLGDLNRFFSALLGGKILAPRQMAEIRNGKGTGGTYGLGLYATALPCGVTVWGHDGDINGSYTRTAGTADGRQVVSFRVNTAPLPDPAHGTAVLTAEFCARRPTGNRPAP
ncbi:beta-lactamase family protein [Streptomyces sioyaensis]|uniref:Class A beta-lactamase-related serine hydrolase n=1 Tax=Streptomyces sioyaensis TaxID=67364 RepID=A0A4Q1QS47_9ACTN|nr:serine hydrolase domain-containing protein [Streptomyces sioyaensis]MBM4795257.1 beta-lactamase family protein [Streptomyces sioyaensis]RXS58435.1 class A beta-lactamase-related serine hydrolase [Streptomyces sioyaensis]